MKSKIAAIISIAATLAFALSPAAAAETEPSPISPDIEFFNYERLSLEQALNLKTGVATKAPVSARESPGIITIVTRDEIRNSGARDLLDVLRLVPGFEFGVDVQGNLGLGFRGIWGNEGKILLLVDGQEYNELSYSTLQLDRFAVEQIERLEIIRGPGSVIYGGNAELAVVSIKTRDWREKGAGAAGLYGASAHGGSRRMLDLRYGHTSADLRLSGAVHLAQTQRSDRTYVDFAGARYPMGGGNSDIKTKSVNLGVERGGFRGRLIVDEHDTTQRDAFGASQDRATHIGFYNYLAEAAYELKLGERWTLTPRFNLNHQRPWYEKDEFFPFDKTISRYRESLTASFEAAESLRLLSGAELQQDRARVSDDTRAAALWPGGNRRIGYDNRALFLQAVLDTSFGSLTAGGRYEHHSAFSESFVPRFAWTFVRERLHVKALYSEAFRAPSIENIRLNTGIRPESMTTYELETGYELGRTVYASAAFFDMTLRKPIVFHSDPVTNTEFYSNDEPTGTRGCEIAARWKDGRNYVDASYSFYSATKNRVPLYAVPGRGDVLLGLPAHKLALNASFDLGRGFSVNPSAVLLAERYGYFARDASGNSLFRRNSDAVMLNLFLQKRDAFRKGLDIGVGGFDLLASNYSYIQPYNSGHSPLPGPSREFTVRLSLAF